MTPVYPPPQQLSPAPPMPNSSSTADRQRVSDRVIDRFVGVPAWVVVTQLFIGLGWLRAVAEKVTDPDWWTGEVIGGFLAGREGQTLAWYQPFADSIVLPAAALVAAVVLLSQLFAGVSLVTGRRLGAGLAVGMFLNLHFMAAGAVTPSAFYLLAQGTLALWLAEHTSGASGADGRPIGNRASDTRAPDTSASAKRAARRLSSAATIALFLVGLNLPLISTLDPKHVIEDPAVMFAFGGSLVALGCLLAAGRRSCRSLATPL